MKKRIPYIILTILLFGIEILIGTYVHDKFIRPYFGDFLVVILICCFFRSIHPEKPKLLAVWVFLLGVAMEFVQLFKLAHRLGVEGTVWGIVIGSSFSYLDIVCYFFGCLLFYVAEKYFTQIKR